MLYIRASSHTLPYQVEKPIPCRRRCSSNACFNIVLPVRVFNLIKNVIQCIIHAILGGMTPNSPSVIKLLVVALTLRSCNKVTQVHLVNSFPTGWLYTPDVASVRQHWLYERLE